MIAAVPRRIARFFGSMAGQIFILLTIGIAASAIISLFIAEQARRHDFERIRLQRVVASAADIAERLQREPKRIEAMLARQMIMGAASAPEGIAIVQPDTTLEAALAARFGPNAHPEAGQVPTSLCFPGNRLDPRDSAAGIVGAPRPDCWIVRFTDRSGQRRSLAIDLPRLIFPPSATLNPLYLALIILSSAGLSIVVARLVTKPLRRLRGAADAFSLSRDPEPITEYGPSEVRAALSTFNLMQQRIRAGFTERTQLLAAISHDLQTPLTRLRLRLEQVKDEELRARLLQDHRAMQTLVREGLDLASSTESQEEWSIIDIDSLLASLAEDAEELGSPVRFTGGCGSTVRVKPNALSRCIGNLLDNAIKYGGSAAISCERLPSHILIRIRDRGPGIEEDQLDAMFEPFTRGPAGQPGGRQGTGIGLTIARALALNFEGSVKLENAAGGGLVATIELKT
ncbi:MAG: ATP-binding protein [Sphingobium sp.]